jgi:diacylglycerol kinase family enzyme
MLVPQVKPRVVRVQRELEGVGLASYALIVNPTSGRGKAPAKAAALRSALFDGGTLEVHETTGRGSAADLAASLGRSVDGVIAVGGDGTLNEVLNGLLRSRQGRSGGAALGFLPAGTGNAASLAFGFPADPSLAAQAILSADPVAIDVGFAVSASWERAFLLWLGAGMDAVLISALDASRDSTMGVGGLLGRAPEVLGALKRYTQPPIEVEVLGWPAEVFGSVIIANVGQIPFGGSVTDRAVPNDGLLNVVGLPAASLPRALLRGRHLLFSSLSKARGVQERMAETCLLDSEGTVPVQVDGEPIGVLPARVTVVRGGVRVLGSAL